MDWRLDKMHDDRISLVNRTGEDAHGVIIQAVGPVVIGGSRGWTGNYEVVHHGASVELKWIKGWSPERPGLRIAWTPPGGEDERTRIQTVWLD